MNWLLRLFRQKPKWPVCAKCHYPGYPQIIHYEDESISECQACRAHEAGVVFVTEKHFKRLSKHFGL